MKLLQYIERINLIHKLIGERRTGTPKEFSERLRMSESRLYQLIEELKIMEVPIAYSREFHSYYYTIPFKLSAHIEILPLTELRNIRGGAMDMVKYFIL